MSSDWPMLLKLQNEIKVCMTLPLASNILHYRGRIYLKILTTHLLLRTHLLQLMHL